MSDTSTRLETLISEARKLCQDERIALVENILASLAATDPAIDRQWADEATRRYEAFKRGEMKAYDLEDILETYASR